MNLTTNVVKMDKKNWAKGIARSFISGGAGALGSGVGGMAVDPTHFNVGGGGTVHMLTLMGATFLITGLLRLAEFLQAHPIPDDDQSAQTPVPESPKP